MPTDAELLHRYASAGQEDAFAELVRRHVNLVYAAALRQLGGDAHAARDVAQAVFTDLARKAAQVARREVIASWLYTSTRFAAANVRRARGRRRKHEREAETMHALEREATPDGEGEDLRPLVDEVMHALNERERGALVLRFFEGRPFAEIGAAYGWSEDAARMRVERALEKLRGLLARRGITSTGSALALALAQQAGVAAPAGLATAITGAALAKAAAGGAGVATIFMKTLTWTAAGVAVVALGIAVHEYQARRRVEAQQVAAHAELGELRARLGAAEQRAAQAVQQEAASRAAVEKLRATPATAPASAQSAAPAGGAFYLGGSEQAQTPPRGMSLSEAMSTLYAALFRQLGFTPEQRAQFVALMVEWKERGNALFGAALAAGAKPQTGEQERELVRRAVEPAAAERDAKLRALFGDGVYQAFQTYEETHRLRSVAGELATQLFHTDLPLSAPQSDQLVAIMTANARNAEGRIDFLTMDNATVLAQARGVLAEPQLEAFRRKIEIAQAQEQFARQRARPLAGEKRE